MPTGGEMDQMSGSTTTTPEQLEGPVASARGGVPRGLSSACEQEGEPLFMTFLDLMTELLLDHEAVKNDLELCCFR